MFDDQGIFTRERERILSRSWVYLAHESEIPEEGDDVLRYIVDDLLMVVRDEDGVIPAIHHQCQHRGMQPCRSEEGNASNSPCPCHGGTYRNAGIHTGRTHRVNSPTGMKRQVDERWPGPGVAQPANFTDANLRSSYDRWLELVTDDVRKPLTRNGEHLQVHSPKLGFATDLDPLELELLTWRQPETFARLLEAPYGHEDGTADICPLTEPFRRRRPRPGHGPLVAGSLLARPLIAGLT